MNIIARAALYLYDGSQAAPIFPDKVGKPGDEAAAYLSTVADKLMASDGSRTTCVEPNSAQEEMLRRFILTPFQEAADALMRSMDETMQALEIPREKMLRALAVSDLISIYQKSGIGCLSAFCGAVSAGTGAACGIAYLLGGRMEEIEHTIVNSLGTVSGMVCDGAKPSCAAKIAMAIESGVFGYRLFKNGNEFYAGDGIVTMGVDETIRNVSRMAREGMRETDREILSIMIDSE